MSKFHAYDVEGNVLCGSKSVTLLAVSTSDFLARLESDKCSRCNKKLKSEPARSDYFMPRLHEGDHVVNLVNFLLLNTKSCWGYWSGYMSAADQRKLFGRFLGKGKLVINGTNETLTMVVKVAFGQDFDERERVSWKDL